MKKFLTVLTALTLTSGTIVGTTVATKFTAHHEVFSSNLTNSDSSLRKIAFEENIRTISLDGVVKILQLNISKKTLEKWKNSKDKNDQINTFVDNIQYLDRKGEVIDYKSNLFKPGFSYKWIRKFNPCLKDILQEQVKNEDFFAKTNDQGIVIKLSFQSLDNVYIKSPKCEKILTFTPIKLNNVRMLNAHGSNKWVDVNIHADTLQQLSNSKNKNSAISNFVDNIEYLHLDGSVIDKNSGELSENDFDFSAFVKQFSPWLKQILQEQVTKPDIFNNSTKIGINMSFSFQTTLNKIQWVKLEAFKPITETSEIN